MGAKIRPTNGEVLLRTRVKPPGAVIANAVQSGYRLAYNQRGVLSPYGNFSPEKCRWAKEVPGGEEKSLIPCITALVIKYLQFGRPSARGKRVKPKAAQV